ncbi:MAG TPA: hypothetical protein PLX23_03700 [Candidatus Hydrogenedens sp.]|nr:hypothetical protein [Candidatus Hydrogenedens sp.]
MITKPQLTTCTERGRKMVYGIKGEGKITVKENPIIFSFEIDKKGRRITPQNNDVEKNFNCLFFGCSFTFGTGVNDDQTMPFYFGQIHPECKIYNYGIPGGAPQEIYLQSCDNEIFDDIEEKPTIIIYTFISDHLRRLRGTVNLIFRAPNWVGCLPNLAIVNDNLVYKGKFEETNPYLFTLGNYLSKSFVIKKLFDLTQIDYPYPFTDSNYDFLLTLLLKTKEKLITYFPILDFILFVYPEHCVNLATCPKLQYFVNQLEQQKDITLILCDDDKMLQKYLKLRSDGKHIILDGHPSPESYKLFAEWISKDLSKQGIIK